MLHLHQVAAVAQRILTELIRRQRSLMFWLIFPVLLLLLNGTIMRERLQLTFGEAIAQAAPGSLVGAALFFSCLGGSVATVVGEREQQTLKRLFLSPLTGGDYFLGIVIAHVLIGFAQTLVIAGLAWYWDGAFSGSPWLGLAIVLLSILAYVGVGFILGTQLARRTEDVNALVATFGVPLLILGGAFFPASVFPKDLLKLARWNPIYHMNEALTAVWVNDEGIAAIEDHLLFLGGFSLGMIVLGWLTYAQMVQRERQL